MLIGSLREREMEVEKAKEQESERKYSKKMN